MPLARTQTASDRFSEAVETPLTVLANALRRTRALLTHHRLHFVLLSVVGILFACAALVLLFERHAKGSSIHDSGQALWWATTVGYGTRFPVTAAGQGVAVVLLLVGVGVIGVLTATVASYFVEAKAGQEKTEIEERLDRIEAMLVRLADAGSDSTPGW